MIANGKRIEDLASKRAQLIADLATIDEELQPLLADGQMELSLTTTRAAQKCSKCGQEGHTKRTCTQPAGAANG